MSDKRYRVLVRHVAVYENEFPVMAFDKAEAEGLACHIAVNYGWSSNEYPAEENDTVVRVTEDTE